MGYAQMEDSQSVHGQLDDALGISTMEICTRHAHTHTGSRGPCLHAACAVGIFKCVDPQVIGKSCCTSELLHIASA